MPNSTATADQGTLWAITDAGLDRYQAIMQTIQSQIAAGTLQISQGSEDEEEPSPLLQRIGRTGVLSIRGPLVNTDSPWNSYFGLVSYNSIKSALIEAAVDPDIDQILLDVDSPGGAVNGVDSTAELISAVDAQIKPVHAFADGLMCSGAYWLAASARSISAGRVAEIGSIGVIMTHMERSKMLADMGIKATVIRAGKYKQMGNPNEPLSEEGLAELQSMVDSIYKIFVSHVAEQRGKGFDYADKYMAQGRVFIAENAVQVGLIDQISSFEAVLAELNAKKVDRQKFSFENNGIGAKMAKHNKNTLVSAVEAALVAAGHVTVEDVTAQTTETDETVVAAAAAAAAAAAETAGDTAATIETSTEVSTETSTSTVKAEDETAKVLRTQLQERDDQLIEAKADNKVLTKQLEQAESSMAGLKAIAVKSINAMQVALGGSASSFESASAQDILAAHTNLSADFAKNFKAGGVAAVEVNTEESAEKVAQDSLWAAKLNAV